MDMDLQATHVIYAQRAKLLLEAHRAVITVSQVKIPMQALVPVELALQELDGELVIMAAEYVQQDTPQQVYLLLVKMLHVYNALLEAFAQRTIIPLLLERHNLADI